MSKGLNNNFSTIASATIEHIATCIENQDPEGIVDTDHLGDILNIFTSKGQYVINKHSAAQEIWLASPKSGPYHFAYQANKKLWLDSKNNELYKLITDELKEFIKIDLSGV